jgi:hypothetical protein
MNPEQQRIAIAEACGHINVRMWGGSCIASAGISTDGIYWGSYGVPDYCNDLNAMHEAEQIFDHALYCRYINELCDITIKGNNSIYMATARQRAEAFLKTINKWEGGSDE